MEKLRQKDGMSPDLTADIVEKIKEIVPEAFVEGHIDFDVLKQTLGEYVDDQDERYSFTWHGKNRARQIAQMPSSGTLLPCPEESVSWDTTKNVFIEGDNLEVLKLLQKSYHRKVKMIYIDPPYNTGGEFIYPDKWQDNLDTYLRYTGQTSKEGLKLSANPETSGRYHTNWLNMMLPRLKLCRNLLRDDGSIFVSIDDHESHNLRMLMDEVFGPENFIAIFAWQKRYSPPPDTKDVGYQHESVLMYRKSDQFKANLLPLGQDQVARYANPDNDPRGPWKSADYTCRYTAEERPTLYYPIENPITGEMVWPKKSRVWSSSESVTRTNIEESRLWWGQTGSNSTPALKNFLSDIQQGRTPSSLLLHDEVGHTDEAAKEFRESVPGVKFPTKPTRLIRHLLRIGGSSDGLILDFFAGSGTTGHAVFSANEAEDTNYRFILVQLPEPIKETSFTTIAEISKARLRKGAILTAQSSKTPQTKKTKEDKDLGFKVFKLGSSNIKPWDADFDTMENDLMEAIDNIKADRTENDVLFELLLKYGLDLAIPIETRNIAGSKVNVMGTGALVVCLEDDISLEVVSGIAALKEELKPEIMRVVFKDSGFADDVTKTNANQILRQEGIDDVKSL